MIEFAGRKADHLDLCASGNVGYRRSTLLECVEFVHDALPEIDFDEIDTSTTLLGKTLKAPIVIAAMTGGTERARIINEELVSIAEELGIGFGLGSQRPMLIDPATTSSYSFRHRAKSALIFGNIGGVQAVSLSTERVAELVDNVGADALCIHLNPAMELIQAEGDRSFRGVLDAIERLVKSLEVPVIVKETGSGLSGSVARRLRARGVRHVDVSGAGGTSWVAVETERAAGLRRSLGETFREWGIPTAASVGLCSREGFETVIATGGVTTGLEVAQALSLGASASGIARPVLMAYERGGGVAVRSYLERVLLELKTTMLLVAAKHLPALRQVTRIVSPPLSEYLKGSL
jgi:isopentenyl-diphosphate delta-isomerase